MRTFIFTILFLALAVSVNAQVGPAPLALSPGGINLELKDVPLKQAFERLFESAGDRPARYQLDPAFDKPPYDKVKVSLKLQNAQLYDALNRLANAHDLCVTRLGGRYVIGPKPAVEVDTSYQPPQAPGQPVPPGAKAPTKPEKELMTVSIPAMPVRAALGMLYKQGDSESPWEFKGGLDTARMPGAKFYRFPRDEAAKVLLFAAGLAPPASGKVVTSKGSVRLSDILQYTPVWSGGQTAGQAAYPGYGGAYGGFMKYGAYPQAGAQGGTAPGTGQGYVPAVAVAAYKSGTFGDKWLFTVLCAQEWDIGVLEKLLATSGRSYVMARVSERPYSKTMTSIKAGRPSISSYVDSMYPSMISVSLYDVTLDQALDSILPNVLLKYRKQGPPDNPIYVIYPSEPIVIWRADEATTAPGKPQPAKK